MTDLQKYLVKTNTTKKTFISLDLIGLKQKPQKKKKRQNKTKSEKNNPKAPNPFSMYLDEQKSMPTSVQLLAY